MKEKDKKTSQCLEINLLKKIISAAQKELKKIIKKFVNIFRKTLSVGSLITFYYSVTVVADPIRLDGSLWPDLLPDLWQS